MAKPKFSAYFYNSITYLGVVLALLIFLLECFLFVLEMLAHGQNIYLGLLTYIYLPPFLILGFLLIPLGALWKKRRVLKGLSPIEPRTFRIDPANPEHRNAILVFIVGTGILVLMTFVGAYKGFHYTESVEFCGLTCHKVMKPEHTTYLNSPHSRVRCIECHVGSGAESYLRSKMTGARQMYRAITNTYHRPVRTPVKTLRPAPETCEQCHWPGKSYSTYDLHRTYFTSERGSTPWKLRMLLNVGGGKGEHAGVHAHMNVERDVYYAADESRQEISWVKSVDREGNTTVFTTEDSPYASEEPPAAMIRKMDCVDCHNRPTHHFLSPYRIVNDSMASGEVDRDIPKIKEKSVELLAAEYATEAEGMEGIRRSLHEYYASEHADYYAQNRDKVEQAGESLAEKFSKNMFPEMKARWDKFPDNIGHWMSPGCFRCHGGEHRSPEGRVITRDCNACHTIIEQGPEDAVVKDLDGLPFQHPSDDEQWKEMNCTDCHSGGPM